MKWAFWRKGGSSGQPVTLVWLQACGSFERQLQRRHNNPLFAKAKRTVTTAELTEARSQDIRDQLQLREDSSKILDYFSDEGGSRMTFTQLDKIRDALGKLIIQAASIGELARPERQRLRAAYDVLVASTRDACPARHKPELEAALVKYEGYLKAFANDFVAQFNRKDTLILADGLVASLLVEDVETVRIMVSLMPENERIAMAKAAESMIEDARKEGYEVLDSDEKLKTFQQNQCVPGRVAQA